MYDQLGEMALELARQGKLPAADAAAEQQTQETPETVSFDEAREAYIAVGIVGWGLTPNEAALYATLAWNLGGFCSREMLMKAMGGKEPVSPGVLEFTVAQLRTRFALDASKPAVLVTARYGREEEESGYILTKDPPREFEHLPILERLVGTAQAGPAIADRHTITFQALSPEELLSRQEALAKAPAQAALYNVLYQAQLSRPGEAVKSEEISEAMRKGSITHSTRIGDAVSDLRRVMKENRWGQTIMLIDGYGYMLVALEERA